MFEVHIATTSDAQQVNQWLEDALLGGYGRDGGTGLGQIDVVEVGESMLPSCAGANAGMLLGPCIPAEGDPSPLFVRHGVRCGRLGGTFSTGTPPGGTIQKRPMHVLEHGSLLKSTPDRTWVGRSPAGVHSGHAGIRQYGHSIILPCRVSGQVLQEAIRIREAMLT